MRRIIGVCVLFSVHSFASFSEKTVGLTFPEIFQGALKVDLDNSKKIGVTWGGMPADRLFAVDQSLSKASFSESYDVQTSPRGFLLSAGLQLDHSFGAESSWMLRQSLGILFLNLGGDLHIQNKGQDGVLFLASLEVQTAIPLYKIEPTYRFQFEQSALDVGVGATVILPLWTQTRVRGPLLSLMAIAPEYREAFVDGTQAASDSLNDTVNKVFDSWRLWPSLSITYVFY